MLEPQDGDAGCGHSRLKWGAPLLAVFLLVVALDAAHHRLAAGPQQALQLSLRPLTVPTVSSAAILPRFAPSTRRPEGGRLPVDLPLRATAAPAGAAACGPGAACAAAQRALAALQSLSAVQAVAGAAFVIALVAILRSSPEAAPKPADAAEEASKSELQRFASAVWQFVRPHTIRGTVVGSFAVVAKSLLANVGLIQLALVPRALLGLVALLCGNGYIVGINQIYDVDIDKVNKPFLPVAAGKLSPGQAWVLVAALSMVGATIVSTHFGPLITALYVFGLFLGTIYSVPPLRLKRFAVPAFMIIATCRGFLLNWGVFYAVRAALGLPFVWVPQIQFITIFMVVFAVVISITKDLPDTAGDKQFGIRTLSTTLGVAAVSKAALALLLLNYAGAMSWAVWMPHVFSRPIMIGGHAVLAGYLMYHFRALATAGYTTDALKTFYSKIWNLFYSEYLLFVAV